MTRTAQDARPIQRISRRRAIAIAGVAAGLPLVTALTLGRDRNLVHRWSGQVLGAQASITLYHPDAAAAASIVACCLREVERLEAIFSLYRSDSELSRLNRFGRLDEPSLDMVTLLAESLRWGALTDGAFDVAVQPLFALYAAYFGTNPNDEVGPAPEAIAAACHLVDYRAVVLDPEQVSFARPGMALTFNGIAQGYITDRVGDLLRDAGLNHVLLDLGEMRMLGGRGDGRNWWIGLRDPVRPAGTSGSIELSQGAIASSGGYGLRFDAAGRHHHLFDPLTGRSANDVAGVTVIADRATTADALSTALAVVPLDRIPVIHAAAAPIAGPLTIIVVTPDGETKLLAAEARVRVTL